MTGDYFHTHRHVHAARAVAGGFRVLHWHTRMLHCCPRRSLLIEATSVAGGWECRIDSRECRLREPRMQHWRTGILHWGTEKRQAWERGAGSGEQESGTGERTMAAVARVDTDCSSFPGMKIWGNEKGRLMAAFFLLIPYFQNTKLSLKTSQISLHILARKPCGIRDKTSVPFTEA